MRALPFLAVLAGSGTVHGAPAPAFELRRDGSGEAMRLEDFAGQILVLDFFAYWCVPCARTSPILEEGIREHYRSGNPQGVAVRLLSVNVESEHPGKTGDFVRKHGLSLVAHDAGGVALGRYGGKALPYLVIVDGTRGSPGQPEFEVVYRHAGFEGIKKLRAVIDGLGKREP